MNYAEQLQELIKEIKLKILTGAYEIEEEKKMGFVVEGLQKALSLYYKTFGDRLVVGEIYYVINYKDGIKTMPYVSQMKLYKITTAKNNKNWYSFTFALKNNRWLAKSTPDLKLSEKGVANRVFPDLKTAEEKIKK